MQREWTVRLLQDAGRVELRHQDGDYWISGLFDDVDALLAEIAVRADRGNLYTTINAPKPLPAMNRMGTHALRDEDIGWHVRLPFDFDPVRPAGMPSTADELDAAVQVRDRFVAALRSQRWPMPALAISGNGAHAIFRVRLPANAESREALAYLYRGMREFSTDEVVFDPSVRNAARVWRLYGTTNRKGAPTPDRQHRTASVSMPLGWQTVPPRAVFDLANLYARAATVTAANVATPRERFASLPGRGDYATLDAVGWFNAHGAYRRKLQSGKHAVRCPWEQEHSTLDAGHSTATVLWTEPGRWPDFHCSHAHCDGRRFRDVLMLWGDADQFCATDYAWIGNGPGKA